MAYFVTGATGFVGRYLVRELLARRGAPVFVLVRSKSGAALEELRRWWGASDLDVVAIEGDLTAPALGVSAADRERLQGQIQHFFHLGAVYDLSASEESLEAANVEGTRNALDFAHTVACRCFHLCSSIASAGLYRGVFSEDMFEEAYGLEHPYFRSKHESEALVRKQMRVPWRIYRPGMVIGHSETGHITKVDGPYYFFKMLQILRRNLPAWLPLIGIEGGYVNVVPVDYVVRAMVHLAHCEGQNGRCFHLTDPAPRRAGDLLNLFARAGHAPVASLRLDLKLMDLIPPAVGETLSSYQPVQAVLDQVLDDLHIPRTVLQFLDLPTVFDNRRTQELLQGSGIRLPALEDYAWRLWDYWERHLDPDVSVDRSLRGAAQGKRILITGGSSGIGRATALRLAAAGAHVLLVARDAEKLAQVEAEIESHAGAVSTYVCDITEEAACKRLVEALLRDHGGIDILIHNAGRSIRRSIAISYDRFHDYERLMQLNYFAAVRLTLALLPHMAARRGGHVIVISSLGVLTNAPRFSGYVASKAALEAFTRSAAAEYRGDGVKFTVINMPLVRTPMIAPTRAYEHVHTLTPEEAAELVTEAVTHKPPRIVSRLGMFAQLMEVFAPRFGDVINTAYFQMFPDSAAARGDGGQEEPPTKEAIALANMLRGVHW